MRPISKEYLETHLPPNVDADKTHALIHGFIIGCASLGFIIFLCKFGSHYNRLFYHLNGQKILREGLMMVSFPKVIHEMCMVNGWGIFMALGYSQQLYGSFFGKSQSIYLMRRLPDDRRTLHHMIADVPLRWALCALAAGLLCVGIAFLIWRFVTPAICLPL